MLNIENGKLTTPRFKISSADSTIELITDQPCKAIGAIRYPDGGVKTFQFSDGETKTARLLITEQDLVGLSEATLSLFLVDGSFSKETNRIPIDLDSWTVRAGLASVASNEILDLKKEIIRLDKKIDALSSSGYMKGIKIADVPTSPGMVPVAMDSKGNYLPAMPFEGCVRTVNGKKASDGAVEILADDIKYDKGKTSGDELRDHAAALKALADALGSLSEEVKKLSKRIAEVEKKLEWHMANGIV